METLNILSPIITLILGGSLTWLFTVKYTRKQAEADAMQHFQVAYKGLIDDLTEDRDRLRKEIDELREMQRRNSARIMVLEQTLLKIAKFACIKAPSCTDCVLIELTQSELKPIETSINYEQ